MIKEKIERLKALKLQRDKVRRYIQKETNKKVICIKTEKTEKTKEKSM